MAASSSFWNYLGGSGYLTGVDDHIGSGHVRSEIGSEESHGGCNVLGRAQSA
jgi:hypothetical protein